MIHNLHTTVLADQGFDNLTNARSVLHDLDSRGDGLGYDAHRLCVVLQGWRLPPGTLDVENGSKIVARVIETATDPD